MLGWGMAFLQYLTTHLAFWNEAWRTGEIYGVGGGRLLPQTVLGRGGRGF